MAVRATYDRKRAAHASGDFITLSFKGKLSNQSTLIHQKMSKNPLHQKQFIRIPLSVMCPGNPAPKGYLPDASTCDEDSLMERRKKTGRSTNGFTNENLGRKISKAVKRKLRLGARILQEGGVKKIFKRFFTVDEEEKLLKAYQCYLSTTAGPVPGLLFISTHKVSFCSERTIKITSPNGKMFRVHYKVSIPLKKMKRLGQSVNLKKASQKYIDIVTVDDFDFWFMGFVNHRKAFRCLQLAFSQTLEVE